jgi:drug/metabolite transporter (DMT)-like permease
LFSALFMVPLAIFLWPTTSIPMAAWLYGAILGVFCTGLAFILYFQLLKKIGVVRTVVVTYLVPVFGMLWGTLFLAENITVKMMIGAALILAGVGLSTRLAGIKS